MEIFAVKHNAQRRQFEAAQEVDGKLYHFIFPDDMLETRSAEYHIQPTEIDLLLDIIMYEGFIEESGEEPPPLFSAATVDEAREKHIARVMDVKRKIRPVANQWRTPQQRAQFMRDCGVTEQSWLDAITEDALQPIRDNHRMDAEVLVEKSLLVRANVEQFKAGRRAMLAREAGADRAAVYRQAREMTEKKIPAVAEEAPNV